MYMGNLHTKKTLPASDASSQSRALNPRCLENPGQSLAVRIERRQREHLLVRCRI